MRKGKKCIYELKPIFKEGKDGGRRQTGVLFCHAERGLEIEVDFVSYKEAKQAKKGSKASKVPEVSLRFTLKKGLLLKLYKFIVAVESLLKDRQFTYYK